MSTPTPARFPTAPASRPLTSSSLQSWNQINSLAGPRPPTLPATPLGPNRPGHGVGSPKGVLSRGIGSARPTPPDSPANYGIFTSFSAQPAANTSSLTSPSQNAQVSDARRARLERILTAEKGKDSIHSKLRLKFLRPGMDPVLQEIINKIIDEYVCLPSLNMSDMDKIQTRIKNAEKEYKMKATGGFYESRPSTGRSRHSLSSRGSDMSRPMTMQSKGNLVSPGRFSDHLMDEWSTLMYADVGNHMDEVMKERERLAGMKKQIRDDLDRISVEKYSRYRAMNDQDTDELSKNNLASEIHMLEEEMNEIENQKKRITEHEARLVEIANKMKRRAAMRQLERAEQDEFLELLKDDLDRQRAIRIEEVKKKHEDMRQGLLQNELRSLRKKEEVLKALQDDRELLQKYIANYDKELHEKEEWESYMKEVRLAQANFFKEPYAKPMIDRSHEDELRAQKELEHIDERIRHNEIERLNKILRDREELQKSVNEIHRAKEERKRQELEEKSRQMEYWRMENEVADRNEEMKRRQQVETNREYAKQLLEQSRGDLMRKRSEWSQMSDTERNMNRGLIERYGTRSMSVGHPPRTEVSTYSQSFSSHTPAPALY